MVKQTLELSRDLTSDLYPLAVQHQPFPQAVESLGRTFHHRYGLTVTVDLKVHRESNPGPLSLRRLVFDAIRELLFNVVKHAQTDQAWVRICCEGESPWRIEVEDRGVGSASIAKPGKSAEISFGLASVCQRLEQIGGRVCIKSSPGEGTRIRLTVPLEANAPDSRD